MRGRLTQVTFRRPRRAKPLTEQERVYEPTPPWRFCADEEEYWNCLSNWRMVNGSAGRSAVGAFKAWRQVDCDEDYARDCQLSAELWIGVGAKMAKAYVPFLDDYEWHASHSLGAI